MSVNESDVDDKELHDKHACAEVIQAWGLYRDQGKWPELLATFTPDGQIAVSWFSGSFREFVDRCTRSFNAGQRSKHHIFPSLVRVAGERAVAETNIVILVRQKIGDVLADMTSYARFLDRLELERASGRWAIVERAAIYERDRLDPVEPSEGFSRLFTATDLTVYPEPYRYMAARLVAAGRALAPVVYSDGSPHTAQLYARFDHLLRAHRARRQGRQLAPNRSRQGLVDHPPASTTRSNRSSTRRGAPVRSNRSKGSARCANESLHCESGWSACCSGACGNACSRSSSSIAASHSRAKRSSRSSRSSSSSRRSCPTAPVRPSSNRHGPPGARG